MDMFLIQLTFFRKMMQKKYEYWLLIQSIQLLFMSWLNMDASNGYHFNSFDSNSNCFYQLREDSASDLAPLFHEPCQESYHYDRSINFADVPLMRERSSSEDSCVQMKKQDIDEESPQWKHSGTSARRGLKCLAQLLIKMLRKKPLQQGEIVSSIEGILCKGKHQDGGKEEKNIKRRIYDALNVMIAAGLLEKNEVYIDIKKKKPSAVFLEVQPLKLQDIQVKVEKKRDLIRRLTSKKQALEYWLKRNRIKTISQKRHHLTFPLVFLMEKQQNFQMSYIKQCILMKANKLQLYSETDIIERMYNIETGQQTLLCDDME